MGEYSIGEALRLFLDKARWTPKVREMRLRQEWAEIVGPTIAKYTRNISLKEGRLSIQTDVAALKQELLYGKEQLIQRVNEYLGETAVTELVIC